MLEAGGHQADWSGRRRRLKGRELSENVSGWRLALPRRGCDELLFQAQPVAASPKEQTDEQQNVAAL